MIHVLINDESGNIIYDCIHDGSKTTVPKLVARLGPPNMWVLRGPTNFETANLAIPLVLTATKQSTR